MEKITKEKKMKKINKLLRIISKTFEVNGELLYQAYKYDSRFQNAIDALDFEVDAKKVCQHLKANAKLFQKILLTKEKR
jgi:translation initiation factor 2 alpha subunit (eIF-2alpha)